MLYADLHLVHEVTSPQAFSMLREKGLRVRRPDRTLATMDHSIPTVRKNGRFEISDDEGRTQLDALFMLNLSSTRPRQATRDRR